MNTVSNRKQAKEAATSPENSDDELDFALVEAEKIRLQNIQEQNRHKEEINKQNLGRLGMIFGDGKNLPTAMALFSIIAAFIVAILLYIAAYNQPEHSETWTRQAERALAIAAAALAYVFGSSKK